MSTTTKALPEIKDNVSTLAKTIQGALSIDKETGTGTVTPDFYVANLPEGVTAETVKSIQAYNTTMAAALTLALGRESIPVMTKNKGLEQTTVNLPTVGKDSFSATFVRSVKTNNPFDKEAAPTDKFGSASVKYDMYGAGSRGQVKAVKENLVAEATAAFGK